MRDKAAECLQKKSHNLYNLMEEVWPCKNLYMASCKDAAYGYQKGLAQKFKIGKAENKDDITSMVCRDGLDETQVNRLLLLLLLFDADIGGDGVAFVCCCCLFQHPPFIDFSEICGPSIHSQPPSIPELRVTNEKIDIQHFKLTV